MSWPRIQGRRSLAFATPGPFRTELNGLVLSGSKVATTGLLSEYDQEGEDIEYVGERLALVNNADEHVATVEVTEVRVCRFDEVPLSHIRARLHEDLRTIGRGALADEVLLDQLVTVLGRSRDVEALIDEDGLQVTGSTGQIRANGLLAEARHLRREAVILIKDLGRLI